MHTGYDASLVSHSGCYVYFISCFHKVYFHSVDYVVYIILIIIIVVIYFQVTEALLQSSLIASSLAAELLLGDMKAHLHPPFQFDVANSFYSNSLRYDPS